MGTSNDAFTTQDLYFDIGYIINDYYASLGNQAVIGSAVMLQLSRDNGKTWGSEMWRDTGLLGEYAKNVEWRRLGSSRRWTAKMRITDAYRRTIMGIYVNPMGP